jgi:nucleotide-binding universal stress UspA family protein
MNDSLPSQTADFSTAEGTAINEIRRILCPVDFTEFSRRAARLAAVWARQFGAEVSALHIRTGGIDPQPAWDGPGELTVVEGDPVSVILERAESLGADLIVLGTHGRRGFDRWVLGSVTERVLHHAPCPVLTVNGRTERPDPEGPAFTNVLCADDLTPGVLPYALSLVRGTGARLEVLHAVEEVPETGAFGETPFAYGPVLLAAARERLHAAIPEGDREAGFVHEEVVCGRAYPQILRRATVEKVDLILMGVHSGRPLNDMFFGSTTHHVVRGADCPVLVVRQSVPPPRGPSGQSL